MKHLPFVGLLFLHEPLSSKLLQLLLLLQTVSSFLIHTPEPFWSRPSFPQRVVRHVFAKRICHLSSNNNGMTSLNFWNNNGGRSLTSCCVSQQRRDTRSILFFSPEMDQSDVSILGWDGEWYSRPRFLRRRSSQFFLARMITFESDKHGESKEKKSSDSRTTDENDKRKQKLKNVQQRYRIIKSKKRKEERKMKLRRRRIKPEITVVEEKITSEGERTTKDVDVKSENIKKKVKVVPINDIVRSRLIWRKKRKPKNGSVVSVAPTKEDNPESDILSYDLQSPSLSEGKRLRVDSTYKSTRKFTLDEENSVKFQNYMTQPVENYSLIAEGSRRWVVRRLQEDEALPYYGSNGNGTFENNYFRIAVPLRPLVGLDLTPLVDVQVIPPTRNAVGLSSYGNEVGDSFTPTTSSSSDANDTVGFGSRWREKIKKRIIQTDSNCIKIQSVCVNLLSSNEDINGTTKLKKKQPTTNFNNETRIGADMASGFFSLKDYETEAIGLVGTFRELFEPQIKLDIVLVWSIDDKNKKPMLQQQSRETLATKNKIELSIKTTTTILFTLPSTSFPLPLPVVKQIGSAFTKQILKILQPKFLLRLENDFVKWSEKN